MKKNYLRQGLKDKKFIENSYYPFVREKNIDWAILIGGFTLQLPYIGATTRYIFGIQLSLFILSTCMAIVYLIFWKLLMQFEEVYDKFRVNAKELTKTAKDNLDFDLTEKTINQLSKELNYLPAKYRKKKAGYKDFMEYVKYDKEDFNEVIRILNKGGNKFGDTLLMVLFMSVELILLREIPTYKKRLYFSLITFVFLTVIFFIFETIDQVLN